MNASDKLEIACAERNRCGEGPIWDDAGHRLLWTDIESALLFQLDPKTSQAMPVQAGLTVSAIALNSTDDLIVGGPTGLHLWSARQPACDYPETDGEVLSFNDIIADLHGCIYGGLSIGAQTGWNDAESFIISRECPADGC
jgi:sugar lactone lactonase YvrE